MRKYENKGDMKVNKIKYQMTVYPHCTLGSENYVGTISVEMEPGDYIPDYIDEYEFIKTYNDVSISCEVLVNKYFDHLWKEYFPSYLKITLDAQTSGHFPVTIEKEKERVEYCCEREE